MSKSDKVLFESMGRRKPRDVVQAEVSDSIMAEIVPPTTLDVALEQLVRSPYQVRQMGDEDEIATLAESLRASGLISPIVVRPVANVEGRLTVKPLPEPSENLTVKFFEIVTGHHRVEAAQRLGWYAIPAVIKHMSDAQAAVALTADNAIKKDLSDWDRYQSVLMLEQVGACKTGREVAATLGVTPAHITQYRAFGKLPERAREAIRRNPSCFGARLAYEMEQQEWNANCPELVTEAFERLADGRIKAQNQVAQWVHLQLAARKPRKFRRELRIQRPGASSVRLVVTDKGAVIDAQGLDADRLVKLLEENLEHLLA